MCGIGARIVLIIPNTTIKRRLSLLADLRLANSAMSAETKKETKDARSSIAFIKTRKRTKKCPQKSKTHL